MKHLALAGLCAASLATSASAFEISGGDVGLRYFQYSSQSSDIDFTALNGNIAFDLGNAIVGQAGLSSEGSSFGTTYSSAELHLGYKLDNGVVLGGFIGTDYETGGYHGHFYGLEGLITANAFTLDVGLRKSQHDYGTGTKISVDGSYTLNSNFDLIAGMSAHDFESNGYTSAYNRAYVGTDFNLSPGMSLSAKFGTESRDVKTLQFDLLYKFGAGKTFKQRG
jgi:hypothetical protein